MALGFVISTVFAMIWHMTVQDVPIQTDIPILFVMIPYPKHIFK